MTKNKKECPRCKGFGEYTRVDMASYDKSRPATKIVECGSCGGTGLVCNLLEKLDAEIKKENQQTLAEIARIHEKTSWFNGDKK